MAQPFPVLTVRDFASLADALWQAKQYRNVSDEVLDEICGFTRGHVSKLLSPRREKNIGKNSLPWIMQGLGVRLRLEPDPDQEKLMASRWAQRNRAQVRVHTHDMSSAQIECARSIIFKQIADRLSLGRQNIPPAERSRIARHAIRTRWKKGRNGRNGHRHNGNGHATAK